MSLKDKLIQSSLLWLPTHLVEDEVEAAMTNNSRANGFIMDFLDGDISLEEAIENLYDLSVNVDEYLQTFDENLTRLGS
jgi:hypothetical protein